MNLDGLFQFKLGKAVSTKEDPKSRLVILERLFVEYFDVNKARKIMYACKNFTSGETNLYPQHHLEPWAGNQKIQLVSKDSKIGGP